MDFSIKFIKGYNCPRKYLLSINDEPIAFADSRNRIGNMIQYVQGGSEEFLSDKSIVGILKPYRELFEKELEKAS